MLIRSLQRDIISSLQLRMYLPCKVLGNLRTTTALLLAFMKFNLMALCNSYVNSCYVLILTLQKPHIPASFNMYMVISKCVTAVKVSNLSGDYLRNRSTLDVGVLGYIGIV